MSLQDKLLQEKSQLESYLLSDHNKGLPQNQLERLKTIYYLLGIGVGTKDVFVFDLSTGNVTTGSNKHSLNYSPYKYKIDGLVLTSSVAPTGSKLIADLNINGVSILSTKISIDTSEFDSTTASVPYVLTNDIIEVGNKLTVDIDQIGSTIAGSDVQLIMYALRL